MSSANFCNICCDTKKNMVVCPYCQFESCNTCSQKYLLDNLTAKCMSCSKQWSLEFIQNTFPATFVNKDYKRHRENVLLEKEKALLPQTQILLEQKKKEEELRKKINEHYAHINAIESEIKRLTGRSEEDVLKENRNVRTIPCVKSSCRGYINITSSPKMECGLCNTKICKDCREETKSDEHKCNPDTVESVKTLEKECKRCPKCACLIYKIAGCFDKDTEILLYDGSVKKASDIVVGDILVGDDGLPRQVLDLCNGIDKMYTIKQNNGVEYIVNSKHSLVLKSHYHKKIRQTNDTIKATYVEDNRIKSKNFETMNEANEFLNTLKDEDDTIHITIDEYLKNIESSKSYERQFHGFKSNGIHWDKKDVKVDPYLLGLWLGDGCVNGLDFAANDDEVISFLLNWCDENGCELVHSDKYKFSIRRQGIGHRKAIGYGSSSKDCDGCKKKKCSFCDIQRQHIEHTNNYQNKNPFKESLESYNLLNNKHVPNDFLCNDEQTRLSLLAGLIDSDGYVNENGKRAVISNTNFVLVKQIELLARSLDFVVNTKRTERKNIIVFGKEPKDYKDIYQINISGELSKIPTLIKRKQMTDSKPNKDWHVTSIKVEYKETAKYYGWKIDGNTRFVLPDLTVVKNCDQMWCIQCKTAFSWRTGKVETGVVHNPHYWEYMRRQGREDDEVRRQFGGGNPNNPCDNNPNNFRFEEMLRNRYFYGKIGTISNELSHIARIIVHITHVEVRRYAVDMNDTSLNRDLRMKYLEKSIDEDGFKSLVQRRQKQREFNQEIHQILVTFSTIAREVFTRYYYHLIGLESQAHIVQCKIDMIKELSNILNFTVNSINKVSKRFSYTFPRMLKQGVFVDIDLWLKKIAKRIEADTEIVMKLEPMPEFDTEKVPKKKKSEEKKKEEKKEEKKTECDAKREEMKTTYKRRNPYSDDESDDETDSDDEKTLAQRIQDIETIVISDDEDDVPLRSLKKK